MHGALEADLNIDALKAGYSMQAQAEDGERQKARAAGQAVRSD